MIVVVTCPDANIYINDTADAFWVMPGYKLEVWKNSSYTNTKLVEGDNTQGETILMVIPSQKNAASSCKLYYKDVEIPNVYNKILTS